MRACGWIALVALLASDAASACSCVRTTLEQQLDDAAIVALVRIESTRVNPAWVAALADEDAPHVQPLLATFASVETMKGSLQQVQHLSSGYGSGDCGLPLTPGVDLLVAGNSHEGELVVSYCSASRAIGFHSLAIENGLASPLEGQPAAYLAAVRGYIGAAEPIPACLTSAGAPPPPPDEDGEDSNRECQEYFDSFTAPE